MSSEWGGGVGLARNANPTGSQFCGSPCTCPTTLALPPTKGKR